MSNISIITVCYNDLISLKRTINSVGNQHFYLKHIIVDGASTDGTRDFLKELKLKSNKIVYISEPDNGVYDAINKAIKFVTSEYVLVLNAGDTLATDDVINKIFSSKYFTHQPYLIGRVEYVYQSGKTKNDSPFFPSKHNIECSHQAFIYKKSLHDKLGKYSLKFNSASDYDFFSKVYKSVGLTQNEKFPFVIAIREKFGGDMSDSFNHTIEMIKIDYINGLLRFTFIRRCKELVIKLIKYLQNK